MENSKLKLEYNRDYEGLYSKDSDIQNTPFQTPMQYSLMPPFNNFEANQVREVNNSNNPYLHNNPPYEAYPYDRPTPLQQPPYHFKPNSMPQNNLANSLAINTGYMPRYVADSYSQPNLAVIKQTHPTPQPFEMAVNTQPISNENLFKSTLRFETVLEAQTAAALRPEEHQLTYINKGQQYTISISDKKHYGGEVSSTLILMFYDPSHNQLAGTYWSIWFNQQPKIENASAIEVDKQFSSDIYDVETSVFDRIHFKWNSANGCKLVIKFNCLSTDFSKIKGVKGIPMRLHAIHRVHDVDFKERSYCKIRIFRDKGAERKNKDDQKHIDKTWEKMKLKSVDEPLLIFAPAFPTTEFKDYSSNFDMGVEEDFILSLESDELLRDEKTVDPKEVLDINSKYIPHLRKRMTLCLFIKLTSEVRYSAVYLEQLTVNELIEKLAAKLQFHPSSVLSVSRVTRKGLTLPMDDFMVRHLKDETDIIIEYNLTTASKMNLILKY